MTKPEAVFEVDYPFVLEEWTEYTIGGPQILPSWRPGIRNEMYGPEGSSELIADGMGKQVLTVVSTHKPGRYPERVFYTRKWLDPSGKSFGVTKLRITTKTNFLRLLRGYRYEFELKETK